MKTISLTAAKQAGLVRYFTGKPCKNGHIAERYVAQSACVLCARDKARDLYQQMDADARARYYDTRKVYVRQWKDTHHERARDLNAKSNASAKQRNPDYFKQYYAKHRELRSSAARAWYHANSEHHITVVNKYRERNPERMRAIGRKNASTRRARKLAQFVEVVDPRVVFQRANGLCGICRGPVDPASRWEVDHVMPLVRGGTHSYDNVQLAHRSCNRRKHAAVPKGQPTLFQVKAK